MSEISCPTFCSNQGHHWILICLLRELSGLVFKTFKNRHHTTSLGYLSPCMIVLVGQNILLASSLNLCFNICLLSLILWHMPVCWVWLLLPVLFVRTGRLMLGPPKSLPFCRLSKPHSLLTELSPQPQALLWPLQNHGSLISSLYWGDQNRTQGFKRDLLGAEQKGIITSLDVLAALLFIQTRMLLAFLLPGDVAGSCPVCCSPGPLGLFGRAAPQPLPLQCLKHEIIALFIWTQITREMDINSPQKHLNPDVFKGQNQDSVLNKTRIVHISLCELVAWNRSLANISTLSTGIQTKRCLNHGIFTNYFVANILIRTPGEMVKLCFLKWFLVFTALSKGHFLTT